MLKDHSWLRLSLVQLARRGGSFVIFGGFFLTVFISVFSVISSVQSNSLMHKITYLRLLLILVYTNENSAGN